MHFLSGKNMEGIDLKRKIKLLYSEVTKTF